MVSRDANGDITGSTETSTDVNGATTVIHKDAGGQETRRVVTQQNGDSQTLTPNGTCSEYTKGGKTYTRGNDPVDDAYPFHADDDPDGWYNANGGKMPGEEEE